jgi:hypothetical protein
MAEETKIEPGKSIVKGFLSNPINWILGIITLGSLLFAAGGKLEKKNYDVSDLNKNVHELKIQSDTISRMLDRHIKAQTITSADVNMKLDEVAGKQDKLSNLVTKEFAKSMTPQQVLDMMNYIEKKNSNNYGSQLIQSHVSSDQ